MKIYIVTAGSYSDYRIEKVFTDKAKAEEYAEWLYDSNPVEEYETEDDLVVNKYYQIQIRMRVHDHGNEAPRVTFFKGGSENHYNRGYTYYSDHHKYSDYFEIAISRTVEAQNWNKEFYVNKYTKAIYDLAAIAKQKRAEGATEKDIQQLFKGMDSGE